MMCISYVTLSGMWYWNVLNYIKKGSVELLISAKCGETYLSTIPTFIWSAGSAALAHRIISVMFRRFMFRRVPIWELIIQHLLFIWMIIYSLHFWAIVVNVTKFFIEYCYTAENGYTLVIEDEESCKLMQQWMIWMFSILPLAVYIQTRPKPATPPLMIWITASPWQRREMGAYGYYLSRPFSSLEPSRNVSIRQQSFALRKAFSDSKTVIKEPPKKRRNSKSI